MGSTKQRDRLIVELRRCFNMDVCECDDEQLLAVTEGSLRRAEIELGLALADLKKVVVEEIRRGLCGLRLWWVGLWVSPRRLIGEMGLRSHRPGGNARDRRQYYRHPVRHSRIHLWNPAYVERKEKKEA